MAAGAEAVRGPEVLRRLVGVYDADGTWRGEVAYWIGARLGRAHCVLCEITHGPFREKTAWKRCADAIPVPFDMLHRDEQSATQRAVTRGRVPCVVAETDRSTRVLLDRAALESCAGDPEALASAIEAAVDGKSAAWPSPPPSPAR